MHYIYANDVIVDWYINLKHEQCSELFPMIQTPDPDNPNTLTPHRPFRGNLRFGSSKSPYLFKLFCNELAIFAESRLLPRMNAWLFGHHVTENVTLHATIHSACHLIKTP